MKKKLVDPKEFDAAEQMLRDFFRGKKGFISVPTQSRLSILAACEDPRTIGMFMYAGNVWPLPQTGQMWLEYELLTKPHVPGYFCVSTSFREEPNPIPGRHDLIFPMFEFETPGDIATLMALEKELLEFLGIQSNRGFVECDYTKTAARYNTKTIEAEHEEKLFKEFGPVVFLSRFPYHTSPFWNMKKVGNCANKIDVLLFGVETIGSAERNTDPREMRELFHTISDGMYASILFSKFGRKRVLKELDEFLSLSFFPRCGGGIGMTRLIRALKRAGKL